jgi:hypothetical protein
MLAFRAFARIRVKQALSRLGQSVERFRARSLLLFAEPHRENAPIGKTIRGRPGRPNIHLRKRQPEKKSFCLFVDQKMAKACK